MSTVQVRYIVDDVAAAIPFYVEQLGFKLEMHPAPPFAMLSRGDLRLALSAPSGMGGGGQSMPDGTVPQPGGWNRFSVHVADITAAVDRLRKAGARFRNEIVSGVGGKQIIVEDPSGNPVELFEPALPEARLQRDEDEIRAVATRQGETWTRHDAKAYAALFTEDCDVVNVVGWWWKGRAQLEQKLTAAFLHVFAESTLTITDVQVRFLAPDIALAHARWTMTGAQTPAGIPEPRAGIQTLVLTKPAGQWLIAGFQNTHSVPELPFPDGPVSAER